MSIPLVFFLFLLSKAANCLDCYYTDPQHVLAGDYEAVLMDCVLTVDKITGERFLKLLSTVELKCYTFVYEKDGIRLADKGCVYAGACGAVQRTMEVETGSTGRMCHECEGDGCNSSAKKNTVFIGAAAVVALIIMM